MSSGRFLIKLLDKKALLVALIPVLLWAQVSKADLSQLGEEKQKVLRQVARDWIQVGTKQYERNFYKQAEQSFFQAVEYQQYLTVAEREKLSSFLEKTYKAELEREHILEQLKAAHELAKQGQANKAKSKLEKFKDSEFLTETERREIAKTLSELREQLNQQTTEISKLYNRSVSLYLTGQLKEARQGFLEVAKSNLLVTPAGKSAEDYLARIDSILARRIELSAETQTRPQKQLLESTVTTIEDTLLDSQAQHRGQAGGQYNGPDKEAIKPLDDSEISNRREIILRSYTRAVVNDAVVKAQAYMEQGRFNKARAAVRTAEVIVNKNRVYLGNKLSRDFDDKLAKLRAEIDRRQTGQSSWY